MSAEEIKTFYEEWKSKTGAMQKELPDMMKGFQTMFGNVMKDGKLGLKEKELVAMAVGLAVRCEPCIYLHVQKCVDAGATREEILEAAAVVVMMQGGPAFTYMPKIIESLEAMGQ